MAFEKIPLEKWKTLTKEEQDYYTLEFQKSREKRERFTIISTRIIALIFIVVLFNMGYVQLQSVRSYEEKLDTYGTMGFCALCGEATLKRCECQYQKTEFGMNPVNRTALAEELSEYNARTCAPFEKFQQQLVSNFTLNNFLNES